MADYLEIDPGRPTAPRQVTGVLRLTPPSFARAQAFAEGVYAAPVALLCCLVLGGICLIDALTPRDATISTLAVFPVLAAAWLLQVRLSLGVAVVAVVLQLVLGFTNSLAWLTISANVAAILAISTAGRSAAVNSSLMRQGRERQLGVLLEAARSLTSSTEMATVLENVVDATAAFISHGEPGLRARATMWKADGGTLEVICEHDDMGTTMKGEVVPISATLAELAQSRRVRALVRGDLSPEMQELYLAAQVEALAAAPIYVGGSLFGILTAASRDDEVFTAAELRLLEGIGDLASLAIANSQKLEFERARTRVFQTLHSIATELSRSANPAQLTRLVVERARDLADADTAALALKEGESSLLRVVADAPETQAFLLRADDAVVAQVMSNKEPALLDETSPPEQLARIAPGARCAGVIPVVSGNRALGVLVIASHSRRFTEDQVQSLLMLSSQLGGGLEDVRLRRNLVESDRRFRSLYAALGCGVVVQDAKGAVIDLNWAAANLLGTTAEDLRQRPPFGTGWSLALEDGTALPAALRPPQAVINFKRPIRNLVAEVARKDGGSIKLRIDSTGIEEQGRLEWIVTSFFELGQSAVRTSPKRSGRAKKLE